MLFNERTFQLSDNTYTPNVSISNKEAILFYPCPTSDKCTSYQFYLLPGKYLIKAYGASSQNKVSLALDPTKSTCISEEDNKKFGGNAKCLTNQSGISGSGGFISGTLDLRKITFFYAHIGGSGVKLKTPPGGYNGGGNGGAGNSGSGGGGTDLRVEVNDFWHRIIVAGGGGGRDSSQGTGGCGGYPNGQGYWDRSNSYIDSHIATQTSGYSFGIGGTPSEETLISDVGGAGGGWFGGYPSNSSSSGAGGGSSFILTSTAQIPQNPGGKPYAFSNNSPYIFKNVENATGIWEGNGKIHISIISIYNNLCTKQTINYWFFSISTLIMILCSNKM